MTRQYWKPNLKDDSADVIYKQLQLLRKILRVRLKFDKATEPLPVWKNQFSDTPIHRLHQIEDMLEFLAPSVEEKQKPTHDFLNWWASVVRDQLRWIEDQKKGFQMNRKQKIVKALLEESKEAEKKPKTNPWAICTKSVGREDKEKYERCVKDVKKKK